MEPRSSTVDCAHVLSMGPENKYSIEKVGGAKSNVAFLAVLLHRPKGRIRYAGDHLLSLSVILIYENSSAFV